MCGQPSDRGQRLKNRTLAWRRGRCPRSVLVRIPFRIEVVVLRSSTWTKSVKLPPWFDSLFQPTTSIIIEWSIMSSISVHRRKPIYLPGRTRVLNYGRRPILCCIAFQEKNHSLNEYRCSKFGLWQIPKKRWLHNDFRFTWITLLQYCRWK